MRKSILLFAALLVLAGCELPALSLTNIPHPTSHRRRRPRSGAP